MDAAAMKHMASNFAKLDKFEGVDFRRWQKKMDFLLSSMSVVYKLTTPNPEDGGDDATAEQIRKRAKWDNDNCVCRGLILNAYFVQDDDVTWWVDSDVTVHVCKDRCWFKNYESLNNGSILHIGNESIALVHGPGCVDLKFSFGKIVSLFNVLHAPNIRKNLVSSSVLNNCGYKQDEALDKFKVFKTEVKLKQGSQIKRFRTDRGGTRDEVSDQHSYCFNVKDVPKTFDEAIKSKDVAFWKEAINDEMDFIMGNNTWVLADLPPDVKTAFLNGDLDKEINIQGVCVALDGAVTPPGPSGELDGMPTLLDG
nr:zinc finger, CCHC-type [Tanacetum cinerariifolium]